MASKNAKIEKVFNYPLLAWSTAQSIPVAWDGKSFDPGVYATAGKYVSQIMLPAMPQNVAIGQNVTQRHTGIYQIDVYTNTTNAKYDANSIVESLEAVYPVGQSLTYNSVSARVNNFYADPIGTEEGWYRIAISIYYRLEI